MTSGIAIVGGDLALVREIVELLDERGFDLATVRVLGGENSAGETFDVGSRHVRIEPAEAGALADVGVGLFCGDGQLARALIGSFSEAGGIAIDGTPFSRRAGGAPLIVPEVNAEQIAMLARGSVIASPMPSTVALSIALAPLHAAASVLRVVTTVFESASQRGAEAIEELSRQSVSLMQGRGLDAEFSEQLAFNVRPQRASAEHHGWSFEERVLAEEVALLFGEPPIDVAATIVRTPVFSGSAQSVYVELERPLGLEEAMRVMREGRGVLLAGDLETESDPGRNEPSADDGALSDEQRGPVDVMGTDAVHVARLRCDPQRPHALAFWIAFDDQRKGIALNMVATAEVALRDLA